MVFHHTEETKEKIRNSVYHKNRKGQNNFMFGKHHSEETLQKMLKQYGAFIVFEI